jgi:hypothetical protein
MATAPIEMRHFLRAFTLEDAAQGVTPIRSADADGKPQLHCPPVLQFRYRENVYINNVKTSQWSAWTTIEFAYEQPAAHEPAAGPAPPA